MVFKKSFYTLLVATGITPFMNLVPSPNTKNHLLFLSELANRK